LRGGGSQPYFKAALLATSSQSSPGWHLLL
jgi:hypothetical protein